MQSRDKRSSADLMIRDVVHAPGCGAVGNVCQWAVHLEGL